MTVEGTVKKFHSLIDKVYHLTNLKMVWGTVKANRGSGGIDKVGIPEFDEVTESELQKLHEELRTGTYNRYQYAG